MFLAKQRSRRPVRTSKLAWVAQHRVHWLDVAATCGSYLGSLPVTAGLTILMAGWLVFTGRSRRDAIVLLVTLLASESIGLLLLALLRHQNIEPARALAWPFGFAGLAPLRGAAVYGMMAHLLNRQFVGRWRLFAPVALLVIVVIGFSVVWTEEQHFTEVLVEYVTGGLILFTGLYWLEGFGLAPKPGPAQPAQPGPEKA